MFHEVPKKWTHSSKCETKWKLYNRVILKISFSLGLSLDLQSFDLSLQSSIYKDKNFKINMRPALLSHPLFLALAISLSLSHKTQNFINSNNLSLSLNTRQIHKISIYLFLIISANNNCACTHLPHTQKSPKKTKKPPI
jgi:hypothetical protein